MRWVIAAPAAALLRSRSSSILKARFSFTHLFSNKAPVLTRRFGRSSRKSSGAIRTRFRSKLWTPTLVLLPTPVLAAAAVRVSPAARHFKRREQPKKNCYGSRKGCWAGRRTTQCSAGKRSSTKRPGNSKSGPSCWREPAGRSRQSRSIRTTIIRR